MFQLTAEELAGIVAVVVGFTEFVKLSKFVDEKYGMLIAALVSALGIAAYATSKPELAFNRTMIWPFISAFLVVLTAAGGVYGIIRTTRGADAMDASGPRNVSRDDPNPPHLPMWLIAVLGTSLLLSGCVKANPNTTPERQVALYGIQAGKYLAEVKTSADELYAKQLLPKPAYEKVLEALVKVNGEGERLGAALKAYDAAITDTERNSVVGQIDAALLALQAALPSVVPEGLPLEVAMRISKGVSEVQRLMLTIARFTAPTGAFMRQTAPGEWGVNRLVLAN